MRLNQLNTIFERKIVNIFFNPSVETYVLGAQKNHLIEIEFFEYPQHMVWLRKKENYFFLRTLTKGLHCLAE